jgi:tetratricopeptide (TPR) repeat protein
MPRFNEDSAFKRHWPLFWLIAVSALIVTSFVSDFTSLGRTFDNQGSAPSVFETQYIFQNNHQRHYYRQAVGTGSLSHETLEQKKQHWLFSGDRFANTATYNGYPDVSAASADVQESRTFLKWLFHRRMGLHFVEHQDYEAAQSEFGTALNYAISLGEKHSAKALSLSDMALVAELRAVEMQQVAQMLLGAALPLFSFLAALLPFALFMIFIKSRDKLGSSREESETAGARLCLKTMLLASWFGVIVTGWVALRNYGMGLAAGWGDPTAVAFLCTIGALLLSCCLMLRYMPPYKSLSLKRSMLGLGFGGVLLILKAVAIYLGLCFSLAGHPALKNVLFCESLYEEKAAQARTLARQAEDCAKRTMLLQPYLQARVLNEMSEILMRSRSGEIERKRVSQIREELKTRAEDDLVTAQNKKVPYVWNATVRSSIPQSLRQQPVSTRNITLGMTFKACLAYLLLFYPECLAYVFLGLKQSEFALQTFNRAVRVKEYFFGVDHWLVVGMMELFGSCLLIYHKQANLSDAGEDYLRQAIVRYERSRGRHDQLTIAAKMALAHFHSERGDDKQAERILYEALRDVGKDFDTLAYSDLLSELGKLFCRRNNYSRAKQMYKQVIDLLEQKLAKCPSSQGFLGVVHNIYATIPAWQLEVKLVHAYLDLAEVFRQAKYNGEAQRLTEDANKRIGAFSGHLAVVMDVAGAYVHARLSLAKLLCDHGRYDECFKLLADAKKQMRRWGYSRYPHYFELVVGECELGIVASHGFSNYFEEARKNYREARLRFGTVYNYPGKTDLKERWQKLGEKLSTTQSKESWFTAAAASTSALASTSQSPSATAWASTAQSSSATAWASSSESSSATGSTTASPATARSNALTLQAQADSRAKSSDSLSDKSVAAKAGIAAKSTADTGSAIKAVGAVAHNVAPSQVIRESHETQDEGIVIRWQRERKEEVKLELRPERG